MESGVLPRLLPGNLLQRKSDPTFTKLEYDLNINKEIPVEERQAEFEFVISGS